MKILVVSDREYRKTSRGIDIITTYLAEKGHAVDHAVFFRRRRYAEKQVAENIRQLYFYDPVKIYRGKLQFIFPGFMLRTYFRNIIRRSSINFENYDYVVLESGHPVYLASEINNKIIYRQSDPVHISFNSNRTFYRKIETEVVAKSVYVLSALDKKYFHSGYTEKIFYWHSGFIPCERPADRNNEKSFIVLGGELDWSLVKKMAKKHSLYRFDIIGIPGIKQKQKNIVLRGYLEYNKYQELLSSARAAIIPFSTHYVHQLRQVSYTAKILVAMEMGMPVLLKSYGAIENSEPDKKLFVYNSHEEALDLLDSITKKIENNEFDYKVSQSTQDFLSPQISENRLKELDDIFQRILK